MSGYFFDLLFVHGTATGPTAGEGEGLTQATRDYVPPSSHHARVTLCVCVCVQRVQVASC